MLTLVLAILVVAFAALSLHSPGLYRKGVAPLCSIREDDLPLFPRAAALGLLLFFGLLVLVPEVVRVVAHHPLTSETFLNWLIAIAFLVVGAALAINPRFSLRLLNWPQREGSVPLLIARIVGTLLMIGGALVIESKILHH